MVFWTNPFRAEVVDALEQLGLSMCVVCGSEVFTVMPQPVVMSVGGPYHHEEVHREEDDALLYYVAVVCEVCGNTLFFDQGKFRAAGNTVLQAGTPGDLAPDGTP